MNFVNLPNTTMTNYLELCNLYVKYNEAWLNFYLQWYQLYLPKK